MHLIMFSHQVGWFDGKRIDIHPWGQRMKSHKWHSCGQQLYVDCICLIELGYLNHWILAYVHMSTIHRMKFMKLTII
jgi:hypothetical protein